MVFNLSCWYSLVTSKQKGCSPRGSRSQKTQTFKKTLPVFLYIEKWDKNEYVEEASNTIVEHLHMVKTNRIKIVPFAHLSRYLMAPKEANQMLEQLFLKLKKQKIEVEKSSFGYHKKLDTSIKEYGHPGNVAFRSIPEDILSEMENIIKEEGLRSRQ